MLLLSTLNNAKQKLLPVKATKRGSGGWKGNCVMWEMNRIKLNFISTISYIIGRIILLAVLGILLSSLVLSITGIILIVVQLIISTIIIIGLIISLIQIIDNLISIKTMTGKSRQISFIQRVEVGAIP